MFFAKLLARVVSKGTISVIDPAGKSRTVGSGMPKVTLRVHDWRTDLHLAVHPTMAAGEAYMNGRLTIEDGTLYDFVEIASRNLDDLASHPVQRVIDGVSAFLRRVQQHNPLHRAQRNVTHHYDLSDRLYESFLDPQRQYSCAYFTHPEMGLDAAQEAKIRHIAAKLLLKPGQRVLDIGCGWGGLALALARMADVEVLGVTLSVGQHKYASERARAAGLEDRVRFELRDYRLLDEEFDRVVSVGMFEHVGVGHYGEFFGKVRTLLKPDGVALLHSIGRHDGPGVTNPWIRRYIFPGGYSPALSEVLPVIETERLWATDIEILRLHYAETLRHWRERFEKHRAEMAALYDERFCRMWELYLIGSELSFRLMGHMVFQIQLAKDIEAVPLTRDYIGAFEKASTPALRSVPDPKAKAKAN
ncbi:cyclopropane-fatty-acyl-phospholipid synthase family protein [Nisaea acidiphila]|uniref:Cyclopropane-fatty-acyl-phospholipid synthase family protein n=1 Tax=Nisaea acidiphila TaxID=1862145 RepID=A0A9J7AKB2_9PROT|nr:cyclopropane-fatty-acyl-phospholipid synthase family protein [Nisaea acidiphila]UUX48107.1 cyclopropane-fatty-acyl-phospholipid synthase family protein [Nisaea acidiphila]